MVIVTNYEPERIQLTVETSSNGILVISECDYPGWIAKVDGVPVTILQANAGIRAIAITAGSHDIILEYQPLSFKLGAAATLLSLSLLLSLAVASLTRRKRFTGSE